MQPSVDALGVSREITNDASLPRGTAYSEQSSDAENFRIEIDNPSVDALRIQATIESRRARDGALQSGPARVSLSRPRAGLPFRSPFLRLVGDEVDVHALGVADRVLHVALRDVVRIRYKFKKVERAVDFRVGKSSREGGRRSAHKADIRIRILRVRPGGLPAIGADTESAIRLGREQGAVANEIWLQCFLSFGDPDRADVQVVDPPPPTLISVGDGDGLPALGAGGIRVRINGRRIPEIRTRRGATPTQTALTIATAVTGAGFLATVTQNPPSEFGAGSGADVLVRTKAGKLVTIVPAGPNVPVGTDARQSVQIGQVNLLDGLMEFTNMNSKSGTLEERTLVKALSDVDARTIEIFIVNKFTAGSRQGEAFIRSSGGPMVNTVILDRNGVRQQRLAWTQAHEIGHVLLNQPYHPDNVGSDRPWLLMDADNSQGVVTGPKRLSVEDCERMLRENDDRALFPLLKPYEY